MNVLGIGVDLVEVGRIAVALERHGDRFRNRVFTSLELEACGSRPERLAARFAAKEAVAKAFGTGIGEAMGFADIEILNDPSGRPRVELHRAAATTARNRGVTSVLVSLSHTATHAIAQAMILGHPST